MLRTAAMFSRPDRAKALEGIAAGYGIEVRKESQLTEVDGDGRRAVIADTKGGTREAHAGEPDWPNGLREMAAAGLVTEEAGRFSARPA